MGDEYHPPFRYKCLVETQWKSDAEDENTTTKHHSKNKIERDECVKACRRRGNHRAVYSVYGWKAGRKMVPLFFLSPLSSKWEKDGAQCMASTCDLEDASISFNFFQ